MRLFNRLSTRLTMNVFGIATLIYLLATIAFYYITFYGFKLAAKDTMTYQMQVVSDLLKEHLWYITKHAEISLKTLVVTQDVAQEVKRFYDADSFVQQVYPGLEFFASLNTSKTRESLLVKNKTWGDLYFKNKKWYIDYTVAKKIDDNSVAVIVMSIPMESIRYYLRNKAIYGIAKFFKISDVNKLGYFLLMSNDERIVLFPKQKSENLIGKKIKAIPNKNYQHNLNSMFSSSKLKAEVFPHDPFLGTSNLYIKTNIIPNHLQLLIVYDLDYLITATHFVFRLTNLFFYLNILILILLLIFIWIITYQLLFPLRNLEKNMWKVCKGQFKFKFAPLKRKDEIGKLSKWFAIMLENLQKHIKELAVSLDEKNRKERELISAEYLQNNLLEYAEQKENIEKKHVHRVQSLLSVKNSSSPGEINYAFTKSNKILDNVKIYRRIIPAQYVSGDFYLYIDLGMDRLFFMVADVSGKGAPAAMVMTFIITLMRHYLAFHPEVSVGKLLEEINQRVCKTYDTIFVTTLCGVLETEKGTVDLYNAGHLPPLIIYDQQAQFYDLAPNFPLGVKLDAQYNYVTLQLKSSAILVLYTDGITEASNDKSELYGEERLLKLLNNKSFFRDPEKIIDLVEEAINQFSSEKTQKDDATLLLISWEKP